MPASANPATPRYAVYWAPEPEHPLWLAGCDWLGRDPARYETPASPPPRYACTPWRYGFHATLKAPMRLRAGCRSEQLWASVAELAATMPAFDMPALQVAWLGRFLALRPVHEPPRDHPLCRLADRCVRELDAWRAPPTSQDLARHSGPGLSAAQAAALKRWGYPHALDTWRFHMTLSDAMDPRDAALERAAVTHFAAALAQPLRALSVAVFVQAEPEGVFRLAQRWPLRGLHHSGESPPT